jgi:limonene-1,2-epoxide hydrolase
MASGLRLADSKRARSRDSEHMTSSKATELVERFSKAWTSGDFETARGLLADDCHFKGPLDEFQRADDYITALRRLQGMLKGVEDEAVISEGDQVADFHVLDTPVGKAPVAEWFTIRGDKIVDIRAYFDARPFAGVQPPG